SDHRVEQRPRQLARPPLHEAHVTSHASEAAEAQRTMAQPESRIPSRVEHCRAKQCPGAGTERLARINQVAGDLEVSINRLARDEQPHDLAGALEDPVDSIVAVHPLDRLGTLPAAAQRVRGLVATTATDLERVIDDPVRLLGVPEL